MDMDTRLYRAMNRADANFTHINGIGDNLAEFDKRLMGEVETFNSQHGTHYDPKESLHDYLETEMDIEYPEVQK